MPRNTAGVTRAGIATAAAALLLLSRAVAWSAQPAAVRPQAPGTATTTAAPKTAAKPSRQSFEDLQAVAQHFADELGRLKEQHQTVSPAELAQQANAEHTYAVATRADPGKKLDTETIYARSRPGVVVVGGIYKCTKCNRWHARCASGFVVRQDGLILTGLHVVEAYKKLDAMGAMTDDGRVFPVRGVLASSRLNDLALLKADADGLRPLPVSDDVAVGATVYCLSHPILASGKVNCFYTFSQGIVCGKFAVHTEKQEPLRVLAITTDYGPGSSGAPILNEHGAVVGMACQAVPLVEREHKESVQMVWKLGRPSCSMLSLLSPPAAKGEAAEAVERANSLPAATVGVP